MLNALKQAKFKLVSIILLELLLQSTNAVTNKIMKATFAMIISVLVCVCLIPMNERISRVVSILHL